MLLYAYRNCPMLRDCDKERLSAASARMVLLGTIVFLALWPPPRRRRRLGLERRALLAGDLRLGGAVLHRFGLADLDRRTQFATSSAPPPRAGPYGAPRLEPLDQEAWYYGRGNRKLNQSVAVLLLYTLVFFVLLAVIDQWRTRGSIYELPGAAVRPRRCRKRSASRRWSAQVRGEPVQRDQVRVPPIDDVKLRLDEATEHAYVVGYGDGSGGGRVRHGHGARQGAFHPLQYSGGDWIRTSASAQI